MRSFKEIIERVVDGNKRYVAIAAAENPETLKAAKGAMELGLADPILIGDTEKIKKIAYEIKLDLTNVQLQHEPDTDLTARKAVQLVSSGEAEILMKGRVHTRPLLKAVLDKKIGLRTNKMLSHLFLLEIPGREKFLALTDCSMNIAPDLEQKVAIIKNSLKVAKILGVELPRIAVLCATETINPKMQATLDASALTQMNRRGQIKGALIDGPLAFDNAVSEFAARLKGIKSDVAGQADILLMPDIEAGNMTYKALVHFCNVEAAGMIIGAAAPIALTSRADTYKTKLNSIALSLYAYKSWSS